MNKKLSVALSILALTSLAACGGGGGGSAAPTGPTDLDYGSAAVTLTRSFQMASLTPTVTGTVDTWTVSAGALPAGLVLDAASGVISGTPSATQAATLATISATETGVGSDTFDLTFTVNEASARALYLANEDDGLLVTQVIDPAEGFVNNEDVITGLDSPRDLTLTPDLEFLYVINSASGTINGYDVDPLTAELTELAGSPFTMLGGIALQPTSITTSADGSFLYVANSFAGSISSFSIGAGGALTELAGSPAGGFANAQDLVSLHRADGDFLYLLAPGLGSPLVAFSISATGALVQVDTETCGPGPTVVVASPEGDLIYVLNLSDSTISGYGVGSDGLLTALAGSPFGTVAGLTTSPLDMLVTSDGTNRFLYTTDNAGVVTQSSIGAAGDLTLIGPGSVVGGGANYRGLAASPDGGHLYLIDQGLDEVHTWRADGTGALDWHPSLGRVRVPGNFLSVALLRSITAPVWTTEAIYAAVKSGNAAQLTIDGTGAMDPISPLLVPTTADTEALVVHPDLDVVYVTNPLDPINSVMSIPIQGDLSLDGTSLAGAATANPPLVLTLTPGGDHALILAQSGSLSSMPIGASGLLGAEGTPLATGLIPLDVAVDVTGQHAYVANFGDNTMSMYSVDLATGALTAKAPATVIAGAGARAIATHPSGRLVYASAIGTGGTGGDLIGHYLVSPTDGTLTLWAATTTATADPGPLACTPDGRFLLVGTSFGGTSSLEVYAINTDLGNAIIDGELTGPVSSAAIPSLGQSIAVSADGSVVYVASNTSATIQAFTIDGSGVLTSLDAETIGGNVREVGLKTTMQ